MALLFDSEGAAPSLVAIGTLAFGNRLSRAAAEPEKEVWWGSPAAEEPARTDVKPFDGSATTPPSGPRPLDEPVRSQKPVDAHSTRGYQRKADA